MQQANIEMDANTATHIQISSDIFIDAHHRYNKKLQERLKKENKHKPVCASGEKTTLIERAICNGDNKVQRRRLSSTSSSSSGSSLDHDFLPDRTTTNKIATRLSPPKSHKSADIRNYPFLETEATHYSTNSEDDDSFSSIPICSADEDFIDDSAIQEFVSDSEIDIDEQIVEHIKFLERKRDSQKDYKMQEKPDIPYSSSMKSPIELDSDSDMSEEISLVTKGKKTRKEKGSIGESHANELHAQIQTNHEVSDSKKAKKSPIKSKKAKKSPIKSKKTKKSPIESDSDSDMSEEISHVIKSKERKQEKGGIAESHVNELHAYDETIHEVSDSKKAKKSPIKSDSVSKMSEEISHVIKSKKRRKGKGSIIESPFNDVDISQTIHKVVDSKKAKKLRIESASGSDMFEDVFHVAKSKKTRKEKGSITKGHLNGVHISQTIHEVSDLPLKKTIVKKPKNTQVKKKKKNNDVSASADTKSVSHNPPHSHMSTVCPTKCIEPYEQNHNVLNLGYKRQGSVNKWLVQYAFNFVVDDAKDAVPCMQGSCPIFVVEYEQSPNPEDITYVQNSSGDKCLSFISALNCCDSFTVMPFHAKHGNRICCPASGRRGKGKRCIVGIVDNCVNEDNEPCSLTYTHLELYRTHALRTKCDVLLVHALKDKQTKRPSNTNTYFFDSNMTRIKRDS